MVGKYIVGERMASGGMAEVFHAEAELGTKLDGPIVLKQMRPELASNQELVAMFVEEARISTRLDHPNIVKVHDFEATDRGLFLVMELVDGPDLLAVLGRCAKLHKTIEPELAVYIACHVLEALDYAHGAASPTGERLKVVHRDVSPSNILITRRGRVKLADFGIARMSYGRTQELASGTLKGKFGYMSPEQVSGDELDARSDVFALAVVLAEMLMMRRLFSAPSDVDLLLMVRRGDLSRLRKYGAHIPAPLLAILEVALRVDRSRRFASADALRNALVEWLATSPQRTGAGRLAELLRELESDGGDLCAWSRNRAGSDGTISGAQTVVARQHASAAAEIGRIAFARARPISPAPESVVLAPFESLTPVRAPTNGLAIDGGALAAGTVVDVLCEIARARRTGALVIHGPTQFKEAYFVDGQPIFVRSDVPEDRFGEFLVQQRALTREQVDRALSVLSHFDGRFGSALVSLGLLHPIEALRLLEGQVAQKLISACTWSAGNYEFTDGAQNPWPALELNLRTFRIVGRALAAVGQDRLGDWIQRVHGRRTHLDLEVARGFDFAPALLDSLAVLEHGTLERAIDRLSTAAARRNVAAGAYVLFRCGVLAVE